MVSYDFTSTHNIIMIAKAYTHSYVNLLKNVEVMIMH